MCFFGLEWLKAWEGQKPLSTTQGLSDLLVLHWGTHKVMYLSSTTLKTGQHSLSIRNLMTILLLTHPISYLLITFKVTLFPCLFVLLELHIVIWCFYSYCHGTMLLQGVGNFPLRTLSGLPVESITGGNLMVLKNTGSKTATLCYKWGTLL